MNQTKIPYLGLFTLLLVAVTVGLAALVWAADQFLSFRLPGGAVAIIPPMAAAMFVGQAWARDEEAMPDKGRLWQFSAIAAAIFFCLRLGLVFATVGFLGVRADVLPVLLGLEVFVALASLLVIRFILPTGIKSQLKAVQRNH